MKIVVVAPLWLPIPPLGYGGIERHVADLVDGLVDHGHEVVLYAPGTTRSKAQNLVAVRPAPLRDDEIPWTDVNYSLVSATRAVQRAEAERADVIIFSVERPYYLAIAALARIPSLFTLHGIWTTQTQPQPEVDMLDSFKTQPFVSISLAQRAQMPSLNYVANVYHGIDLRNPRYRFNAEQEPYAVWLGRLEEEKGPHLAIDVAMKAGIKLKLAGPIRSELDEGREFFNTRIAPRLGPEVEYVGPLEHSNAMDLLRNASVLINPYVYQEAFGYVTLEALACGTPAVVPSWGAGPEIVEKDVSGIVAMSPEDWDTAVERALRLNRRDCHKRATDFTVEKMVAGYEEAILHLIAAHSGPSPVRLAVK